MTDTKDAFPTVEPVNSKDETRRSVFDLNEDEVTGLLDNFDSVEVPLCNDVPLMTAADDNIGIGDEICLLDGPNGLSVNSKEESLNIDADSDGTVLTTFSDTPVVTEADGWLVEKVAVQTSTNDEVCIVDKIIDSRENTDDRETLTPKGDVGVTPTDQVL